MTKIRLPQLAAFVNADQDLTHWRRFSFDPPPGPLGFLGRKAL